MVPLQRLAAACCPGIFYGWWVVVLVGFGESCSSPGHSFFFLNFVNSFIEDVGIPRTTVAGIWSATPLPLRVAHPLPSHVPSGQERGAAVAFRL